MEEEIKKNKGGRPKKDTEQILIRLDKSIIEELKRIAKNKNETANKLITDTITNYLNLMK